LAQGLWQHSNLQVVEESKLTQVKERLRFGRIARLFRNSVNSCSFIESGVNRDSDARPGATHAAFQAPRGKFDM